PSENKPTRSAAGNHLAPRHGYTPLHRPAHRAVKSAGMPTPFKSLLLLTVSALLAACAANPITGRSQFMVVSEKSAIGQSAAAYDSMMGELGKKKKIESYAAAD